MKYATCVLCEKMRGRKRIATHDVTVYYNNAPFVICVCRICDWELFLRGQKAFEAVLVEAIGVILNKKKVLTESRFKELQNPQPRLVVSGVRFPLEKPKE